MPELQEFEVVLSSGLKGTVKRSSRFLDKREFNTVRLSNGAEITVPSASLEPQQDGSFLLRDGHQAGIKAQADASAPPSARNASSEREGKAYESNKADANIEAPLLREEVEVQRVPINRVIDAPVDSRVEDGVTIIPVMEERLKVERQLVLREEIRIVKKRTSVRDPRVASLAKNLGDVPSQGKPEG